MGDPLSREQCRRRQVQVNLLLSCPGSFVSKKRNYFYHMYRQYKDNEIKKHAAVLGLEALINSAPYDIPSWLPSTIEPLCIAASTSKNCASKVSAQKALREFKRTHQDQWEEHKEKTKT